MIDGIIQKVRDVQRDINKIREIAALGKQIEGLDDTSATYLLERLYELKAELVSDPNLHQIVQPIVGALVSRAQTTGQVLSPGELAHIKALYQATTPLSNLRNFLLAWLASGNHEESVQVWAALLCYDPPLHRSGIGIAFSPLLKSTIEPAPWLLEMLLADGVEHLQLAPAVYDLFNFYFREGTVEFHPAADRAEELATLLGHLVGQLGKIEEGSHGVDADPKQLSQQVADSVALIVSLCDTMALIEHEDAIGKLYQALELKHRRVQAEAAASLVRLGDDKGKEALIGLANEPIVRLRVLNYSEELGLLNDISLEMQGEIARTESHLAMWLAEPLQMGIAPSRLELLDNRELYWPSYEHPVQCYLFRYEYGSGDQVYRNVAICGPLVHSFTADLNELGIDDTYALFAGWQTVHDEIFQMSCERAQQAIPNEWRRLNEDLRDSEFDDAEPKLVGSFFGKYVLIASCEKDDNNGTVIVDGEKVNFISEGSPVNPIDSNLAFCIWRGRQLLATFNQHSG